MDVFNFTPPTHPENVHRGNTKIPHFQILTRADRLTNRRDATAETHTGNAQ